MIRIEKSLVHLKGLAQQRLCLFVVPGFHQPTCEILHPIRDFGVISRIRLAVDRQRVLRHAECALVVAHVVVQECDIIQRLANIGVLIAQQVTAHA